MLAIKHLHMTFAVISFIGFFIRGILVLSSSPIMKKKWIRIVPHINDTLLLVSAFTLAGMMGVYPFQSDWLTAKVVGLLVYIGLGFVAMRFGKTKLMQGTAWVLALITFAYIVDVAITKNPMGFLA